MMMQTCHHILLVWMKYAVLRVKKVILVLEVKLANRVQKVILVLKVFRVFQV